MLPAVLFTFEALSVAVFAAKPVPATDTEVADVMPEPFTTTDMVLVVLGAVVPKSTVEPFVGDVNVGVVVDDDEVTVAERFTVMVLVPLWSVSLPVLLPADVPLKVTCTVPPVLLLTLEADRDVVFAENPVPETATEVALVSPEPFTTTDITLDSFTAREPKLTVELFVGEVMPDVVVVV